MIRRSLRTPGTVGARTSAVLLACIGVALSLGVVAPAGAGSAPAFGGPKSFRAGTYPFSVAIRDLNADARSDLAVANYGSSTVSVLLAKGAGRFGAKRDYATGPHPSSLANVGRSVVNC